MNYGGDAADQIVRYSMEGMEHTLRISGSIAKNLAVLIVAASAPSFSSAFFMDISAVTAVRLLSIRVEHLAYPWFMFTISISFFTQYL